MLEGRALGLAEGELAVAFGLRRSPLPDGFVSTRRGFKASPSRLGSLKSSIALVTASATAVPRRIDVVAHLRRPLGPRTFWLAAASCRSDGAGASRITGSARGEALDRTLPPRQALENQRMGGLSNFQRLPRSWGAS